MTKRLLFMGTPDFAVPGLQALFNHPSFEVAAIVTQPDRPAGRGKQVLASPVKRCALEHDFPVLQPLSIRKEWQDFKQQLDALGAIDAAVVIAFGQILPVPFLEYLDNRCYNIHASLLPRWRGAAPIHRAILAGDLESGVCLMQITEGLDAGPVFAEARHQLRDKETTGSLHDTLALLGASLLTEHLLDVIEGSREGVPQSEEGLSYARKIKKEEAIIDWQQTAKSIERSIRAFDPFPGAYTLLEGKRLKLFAAEVKEPMSGIKGAAGEIVLCDKDAFEVYCSDNRTLRVTEVQGAGKKRMSVEEFLKGVPNLEGMMLGESTGQ